jgi:hypothetical protein
MQLAIPFILEEDERAFTAVDANDGSFLKHQKVSEEAFE